MFTEIEQKQIKSRIKMSGLAQKHGVSNEYVCKIFRGKRPARTPKAKAIVHDFQKVLSEIESENQE